MKKGFTLIEILIVVVLMSIASLYGWTNYIAQRQRYLLQTTAEKIKAEIELARTDAINGKYFNDAGLYVINAGSNQCLYIGSGDPLVIPNNCTGTTIYLLPQGVTLIRPNGANKNAFFDLRTGTPNINSTFTNNNNPNDGIVLQYGQFKISIWISQTGIVTVSPPYK